MGLRTLRALAYEWRKVGLRPITLPSGGAKSQQNLFDRDDIAALGLALSSVTKLFLSSTFPRILRPCSSAGVSQTRRSDILRPAGVWHRPARSRGCIIAPGRYPGRFTTISATTRTGPILAWTTVPGRSQCRINGRCLRSTRMASSGFVSACLSARMRQTPLQFGSATLCSY